MFITFLWVIEIFLYYRSEPVIKSRLVVSHKSCEGVMYVKNMTRDNFPNVNVILLLTYPQ